MNITVISVGKIKEKYFTAAIDEYSKRLSRFAKLNIIEVADEKIPDNASEKEMEQIKEKEGNKILAKLPQNSFVVTLCIEGKEHSSEELAKKISFLIKNEEIRKEMGRMARINVDRFKIEHIALQWKTLFESVLKNKN